MHINIFKNIRSASDAHNLIATLKSLSEEHLQSFDSLLMIDGTEFNNLSYILSSTNNDFIFENWFKYQNENGLYGLAHAKSGSVNVEKLTFCEYLQFVFIHNSLWLCLREDTSYDVFVDGSCVLSHVKSYDVLTLRGVNFLKLDTSENRFLLCADMKDMKHGIFSPSSLDKFKKYFGKVVEKLGYSGDLDGITMSDLSQFYYEVQNCIFFNGKFKYLEI